MSRVLLLIGLALAPAARADDGPDKRFPLFEALTGTPAPRLVAYTPSQLDPRQDVNNRRLPTSSIRADLKALRPAFDGLVLYGYHEASTPRILAVAKDLEYRVVLVAIWDIRSAAEIDGAAALCRDHADDFKLGLLARPKDAKAAWAYHGVAFEAFDLPWKAEESRMAVERSWGLLSPKRGPYPALAVWTALGKDR